MLAAAWVRSRFRQTWFMCPLWTRSREGGFRHQTVLAERNLLHLLKGKWFEPDSVCRLG